MPLTGVSTRNDGFTADACQGCGKPHLVIGANITTMLTSLGYTDAEIAGISSDTRDHYEAPNTPASILEAQRARVRDRVRKHRAKRRGASAT